jgi:PadR family transcriptional regulator PadR
MAVGCERYPHSGRLRKYYHVTQEGAGRTADFLAEFDEIVSVYEYVSEAQGNG